MRTPPSASVSIRSSPGSRVTSTSRPGTQRAALHQVEEIGAGGKIGGSGFGGGRDGLGHRGGPDVIEQVHAILRSSVARRFCASSDGLDDPGIGAAAAQIAAHAFADAFGVVAGLALADQPDRAHDLARRAEPALEAVMGDEGGLHRMEPVALGKTLDGQHLGAVQAHRQRKAGIDAPPVDQHRAGAALAAVAALLRSGQDKPLAQKVEQRHPRVLERDVLAVAIDRQADGQSHVRSDR